MKDDDIPRPNQVPAGESLTSKNYIWGRYAKNWTSSWFIEDNKFVFVL